MDKQEQELKIKVYRFIDRDAAGQFLSGSARFDSEYTDADIPDETINLSRKGNNPSCEFRLSDLSNHDGHTPAWQNEQDMEAYIERVVNDATKVLDIGEV